MTRIFFSDLKQPGPKSEIKQSVKLEKIVESGLYQLENSKGCIKSQNTCESGHPEFISGSDIQCFGILKPRLTSVRAGSSG